MPVSVARVQQADVPLTGEWVGTLDGYVNAQIQPQVSGYLDPAGLSRGLAGLERRNYCSKSIRGPSRPRSIRRRDNWTRPRLRSRKPRGRSEQTQAQLELAEINVKRDTPLAEARAIAQSQLDNEKQQAAQARATVSSAQAAVNAARASVSAAQAAVHHRETESRIHRSALAHRWGRGAGHHAGGQPGQPAIGVDFGLATGSHQGLLLHQRQRISGAQPTAPPGRRRSSARSNVPLTLTLSNGQMYPHKGQIVFVDRQMNQQTGAIRIAAAFPNPGGLVASGPVRARYRGHRSPPRRDSGSADCGAGTAGHPAGGCGRPG